MRRSDREIKDINEIIEILNNTNVLHLGINNEIYPYIVPLSFGIDYFDNKITLYVHSAQNGLKLDLIKKNNNVSFESEEFIKTEPIKHGITTRYKSVIGFGKAYILENDLDKKKGLDLIVKHYGYLDFNLDKCNNFEYVTVIKIEVEEIYAKKNIKEENK